jgi:hypothetical protein
MLTIEDLRDTLELLSGNSFNKPTVTDLMMNWYWDDLEGMESLVFEQVAKNFYEQKKFPTVLDFLELGKQSKTDDWFLIMSAVNDSTVTVTISGVSEQALIKVTSARSSIGALRFLVDADKFQISQVRKDWEKRISMPADPNILPPASVEVSLTTKKNPKSKMLNWRDNPDYPDNNFTERAAAMISCITDKKAISLAWISTIDSFPAEKRREVYNFAAAHEYPVMGVTKSKFYQRSISTAKAMENVDEAAINKLIDSELTAKQATKELTQIIN